MSVKRILIADDDAGMLSLLRHALEPLGVEVRDAQTAMAALMIAHQEALDLAVLDINMPGGTGLGACEMLAADPAFSQLAMIILTGQVDQGTVHRCQKLGAHYVRKGPEAVERVRRLVCGLLSVGDWAGAAATTNKLFVG